MELLYLTYAEVRRVYGEERYHKVSRFVKEIPDAFINEVRLQRVHTGFSSSFPASSAQPTATTESAHRSHTYTHTSSGSQVPNKNAWNRRPVSTTRTTTATSVAGSAATRFAAVSAGSASTDGVFPLGGRVAHPKFGDGTVLDYEGSGPHARVQVAFDRAGAKWLVLQYARLESA